MIDPVLSVSLRCLLAALFATAAWHKVADRRRFAAKLSAYRLLPSALVKPFALTLPAAEVGVAVALLLPAYRYAALGAAGLLGVYTMAIAINLLRGRRQIDCGCFRRTSLAPLSPMLVMRNALLIVGATLASLPVTSRRPVWLDGVTIVVSVLAATMVWSAFWRLQVKRTSEDYS